MGGEGMRRVVIESPYAGDVEQAGIDEAIGRDQQVVFRNVEGRS